MAIHAKSSDWTGLDFGGAEDGRGLRPSVAEFLEVFSGVETGLPISDINVEGMLAAGFIDRDTLEDWAVVLRRPDSGLFMQI